MNKRIKLLADEAGIEFTYDPTETPMRAFAECWEDDLERFAELIVRECAGIAHGSDMPGKDIKEHFGVEE